MTRTWPAVLAACGLAAGCMTDSVLAERQAAHARLRAEARAWREHAARLEAYRGRLEAAVRAGTTLGGASTLVAELRRSGFALEKSAPGTLRLMLAEPVGAAEGTQGARGAGSEEGRDGKLGPLAATRLARAATILGERLPGHELSVEAPDIGRAVAAVRVLHDDAGVPGTRLRAAAGRAPGIVLEVRPTRAETLQEVQEVVTALSD